MFTRHETSLRFIDCRDWILPARREPAGAAYAFSKAVYHWAGRLDRAEENGGGNSRRQVPRLASEFAGVHLFHAWSSVIRLDAVCGFIRSCHGDSRKNDKA